MVFAVLPEGCTTSKTLPALSRLVVVQPIVESLELRCGFEVLVVLPADPRFFENDLTRIPLVGNHQKT